MAILCIIQGLFLKKYINYPVRKKKSRLNSIYDHLKVIELFGDLL